MSDEALKEALAEYRDTEASIAAALTGEIQPRSRRSLERDLKTSKRYADALESALSELARLRAEKNSDPVALHAAVHGQSLPESDPGETAGSLAAPCNHSRASERMDDGSVLSDTWCRDCGAPWPYTVQSHEEKQG